MVSMSETVRNHLQSLTVQPVELSQVQIPDGNVGRDPQRTRGRTLPARTLHGGGQICRVGGHIGRCEKKRSNGRRRRLHTWRWPNWWERAVRATDARGSECERDDDTTPRWNFADVSKPSAASQTWTLSAQGLSQLKGCQTASANTCSQFLTDWKHGAGLWSMPSIMASAGWVVLSDHAHAVCPAPMGNSGLHAPVDSGRCARTFGDTGGAGVPKMARRQSQTRSCLSVNAILRSHHTQPEIGYCHISNNSQHAWVSWT